MRTVASKIWLGCLVIVVLGTIAMLAAYRGLLHVQKEMRHLTEVHEPIEDAAHEMEINLKGTAVGTLAYLSAPNPAFDEMIKDNADDFEQFHAQYVRLATTKREKEFGTTVAELYRNFKKQGRDLMARRDRQAATFTDILAKLEEIDRLFDQQLPAALSRKRPEDQNKRDAVTAVDEGIDVIRMRVATYRWARADEHKGLIEQNIAECRDAFQQLKTFEWAGATQAKALQSAEQTFSLAMDKVREVLADEDEIQTGIASYIELRLKMDALLDEDIQPLAATSVRQPLDRADRMVAAVVIQIAWLIGLFLIVASAVSLLLTRAIIRPLKSLTAGTEAVSQGDLACRVTPISRDEFAKLASAFNRMVSHLQETLVSKELLEKSEQELQKSVLALQGEMRERARKEEERARLESSLRRAEMLSAMGALVAGVAHQVRNPLFGISSVLDAMEARLGKREEYRRYLEVLRGEASRVSTLMGELMEYGRAGSGERAIVNVNVAVRDAITACRTIAEKGGVNILESLDESLSEVAVDMPRISRAFESVIENAIQHSPRGSYVAVSSAAVHDVGKDWIEVRVEDHGPGFKPEDLREVFEPFFTKRKGGTGLGLAMVERIVKGHNGQVAAANRPEGGAIVHIRLPDQSSPVPAAEGCRNGHS